MPSQRPRPLDYAPPPRRRFDPATWPAVPPLAASLVFSALLSLSPRFTPGPILLVHADAAPVATALVAAVLAGRSLPASAPGRRAALAVFLLAAGGLLVFKGLDVWHALNRPYARGPLFGF